MNYVKVSYLVALVRILCNNLNSLTKHALSRILTEKRNLLSLNKLVSLMIIQMHIVQFI